jgi:hypothetical protein
MLESAADLENCVTPGLSCNTDAHGGGDNNLSSDVAIETELIDINYHES